MNDTDIIKILECCSKPLGEGCDECPLCLPGCGDVDVDRLALDLIKRQKAEIERLKEPKMLIANIEVSEDVIEKLINQKVISITNDKADVSFLYDKQIRAEAIKEFADIFVEKIIILFNMNYSQAETAREYKKIIVKEMAGDTE